MLLARISYNHTIRQYPCLPVQGTEIIIQADMHLRKALRFQILLFFLSQIYVEILLTANYLGISLHCNLFQA